MNMHLATKIASIAIGVVLGIVVLFFGFQLFQNTFTRAGDEAPRDVVVSDITQNGSKVTWTTGQQNQGVVEYGTSPTALNFFAPETTQATAHSVDLTLLSPTTTYYFQIRIGDKKYDNGGVPWTFTTKGTDSAQPSAETSVAPTQRPVSTIIIPQEDASVTTAPTAAASTCTETDCEKIKEKIGSGCDVQDYLTCKSKSP
jgi:hypothetical protein